MESIGLMFKTFWSPGESTAAISKKPRILVPLILISLLSTSIGIVAIAKIDFGALAIQQMERSGRIQNLNEQQREQTLQFSRRILPVTFIVSGIVGPTLLLTIVTAIYFGIFTLIGREANFKTFFSLTLFAYVPLILRNVVSVVQLFAIPQEQINIQELGSLGLQLLLDPTTSSKVAYALAGAVDIFSIWIMILLCIAYKNGVRKSVGKGLVAVGVVVPYLCFALIGAGLRMLQAG